MPKNSNHNELENVALKTNIFQVPDGYFDMLHKNIMQGIEQEDDGSILNKKSLQENIFEVPPGYFESSKTKIEKTLAGQHTAKVIPLYKRNWTRYAAASIVLIVALVFGIKSDDTISNVSYSSISDEIIIEYLLDEGISNLDILASVDDGITILNDLFDDEMSALEYVSFDNPEMEYDFEYLNY